MKNICRVFLLSLISLSLIGCATILEPFKKFWGSSTQALEGARKNGVGKTYNLDYETSFNKMIEILQKMGCHIFIEDKMRHLIVAFGFQGPDDTTELGIFFTEKELNLTEVELSSTSGSLLNYASEKIFSRMDRVK